MSRKAKVFKCGKNSLKLKLNPTPFIVNDLKLIYYARNFSSINFTSETINCWTLDKSKSFSLIAI